MNQPLESLTVAAEWFAEAKHYAETADMDFAAAAVEIKEWFRNNAALVLVQAVCNHPDLPDAKGEMAKDLGIDRATLHRWESQQGQPLKGTFAGALLSLRIEFPQLRLSHVQHLYRAAAKTVEQVRKKYEGESRCLDEHELELIKEFYTNRRAFEAYHQAIINRNRELLTQVIGDVCRRIRKRYPERRIDSFTATTTIRQWRRSFLLFWIALDEVTWNPLNVHST